MSESYRFEQELHAETHRDYDKLRLEYRALYKAFLDLHRLAIEVDLANYGYSQRMHDAKLLKDAEALWSQK